MKNKIYNCIKETSEDDIENLDIKNLIESIIEKIKQSTKNIELLENINFDEFSIIISLPLNVKIAIESKFKIEGANEIFNSKFLDDKNNIYDYNLKESLEDF
jgi:hypothetical protein